MITVNPPSPVSINSRLEKSANIDNTPLDTEHRFWEYSKLQTFVLSTPFFIFHRAILCLLNGWIGMAGGSVIELIHPTRLFGARLTAQV